MAIYHTLNSAELEIRLISLRPGAFAHEIHCKLHTVSLNEDPRYEALSYVWGDPNNTRQIFLAGSSWNVTANLESALRRLRRANGEVSLLWIDALCINQADIEEREKQVAIMRNIYEKARNVWVWLGSFPSAIEGEEEQMIANAFTVIKQLAMGQHFCEISLFKNLRDSSESNQTYAMSAIQYIWQHPYWKRAWVVQETALASRATIICGPCTTVFDDITNAAWKMTKHMNAGCCSTFLLNLPLNIRNTLYDFTTTIRPLSIVWSRTMDKNDHQPPLLLWELLTMFRSRQSTDPRDKVYAFLGLAALWSKEAEVPLPVNYSQDVSDVFIKTAFKIISEMESLHLLIDNCVDGTRNKTQGLPSWVPDWTFCSSGGEVSLEFATISEKHYTTSGSTKAQPILFGKSILGLWGIKIDGVLDISPSGPDLPVTIRRWWKKSVEPLYNDNDIHQDWQNTFLRTILYDLITPLQDTPVRDGEASPFRITNQQDIDTCKDLIYDMLHPPPSNSSSSSPPSLPNPPHGLHLHLSLRLTRLQDDNRTFFITSSSSSSAEGLPEAPKGSPEAPEGPSSGSSSRKYLGLGPPTLQPNDEVWILLGSPPSIYSSTY